MTFRTKLLLFIFAGACFSLFTLSSIAVYRMHLLSEASLTNQKKALLQDYDSLIKGQVQSAVSLLAAMEAKVQRGELTTDEAKKQGADLVRQLRYQKENYFWIDTLDGTNVVLMGKPAEEKAGSTFRTRRANT